jgi:hypothetical protein
MEPCWLLIVSPMARRSCVERLVSDELWALVEPLIRNRAGRGEDEQGDRAFPIVLPGGVLSVLKTGISWNELPRELGCGSGVTC